MIARSLPFGDQSASKIFSIISRGAPPTRGIRASVPLWQTPPRELAIQQDGHFAAGRNRLNCGDAIIDLSFQRSRLRTFEAAGKQLFGLSIKGRAIDKRIPIGRKPRSAYEAAAKSELTECRLRDLMRAP